MTINEVFAVDEAYLLEIVEYLWQSGESELTVNPIRESADKVNLLYRELFPSDS